MALTADDLPFSTVAFKDPAKQIASDVVVVSKDAAQSGQYLCAVTDERNQNRFELLAHNLPDVAYADALLKAFEEKLTTSGFKVVDGAKEMSFDMNDGSTLKGRHAVYSYAGPNVPNIHIEMFAFVSKSTAAILVGYYGVDGIAEGEKVFKKIVTTFEDKNR